MADTRVLVVVFDALRPEFVTPRQMPNLSNFAEKGVRYLNSHSTFPTETRVNQSAVTTGCMPRRHGIVGNRFIADDLQPGLLVNSGDDAMLEAAFAAGPVFSVPTLGQRLTRAGKSYAALSAGTPGGGRLINWSAQADGTFRLAMRRPEACAPSGVFERIVDTIGPLPDYTLPAKAWITWAVTAYLDYVEPQVAPDVMLLWLCEPDESFHWKGIGSDAAEETLAHVDAEFGRILEHHAEEIRAGTLQIVAMSDHGQLSLEGERLDLPARLGEAGFRASTSTMDGADCVVALANGGGIWVRDRDPDLTAQIVEFLQTQDWCGPLFTRDGTGGTLKQEELCVDHARAPDISLAMAAGDAPNDAGVAGLSLHDAPYPEGGGCHGGLSQWELHNVLVLGGQAFRQGIEVHTPAGNIDVLPTVAALLGLDIPDGIDGRVLSEAFADGPDPDSVTWEDTMLTSRNSDGARTHLSVSDIGSTRYLNRAWVTSS